MRKDDDRVWSLYIIECNDGSYYTGIALDPAKRFASHCAGQGARYTRIHPPKAILVTEIIGTYSQALRRELQVKRLSKMAKHKFVLNPKQLMPPNANNKDRILLAKGPNKKVRTPLMSLFKDFNLLPSLQATLTEKGLLTPTEIQDKAIPILLAGRSMVGVAETGSGKTLAYALPILHLLKDLENKGSKVSADSQPRALVIVPTRELGEQVSRVFKPFTHNTRLRVRTVLGGTTMEIAKKNIKGSLEVLVATPGRLVQFINQRLISLRDIRVLVFDEADQMLDQGFLPDAHKIVSVCPPDRQMALFSATVSVSVQALINKLFASAEVIRSQGSHHVVPTLITKNVKVIDGKRFPLLKKLLADKVTGGTLIFTNTRDQCDKLALELKKLKRPCLIYRGEMNKVERRANLKAFRASQIDLLISTDLASRGLDVDHVGRIINYHMPQHLDNYLHRVGRTARAGREGLVINFVTERDEPLMNQLESVRATTPRRKFK